MSQNNAKLMLTYNPTWVLTNGNNSKIQATDTQFFKVLWEETRQDRIIN
jgi:hypothetical protein